MTNTNKGLPPLRIQFDQGYGDFFAGNLDNKYNSNTMRGKEWQRGFNAAYEWQRIKVS
jgi:hypothetical protein